MEYKHRRCVYASLNTESSSLDALCAMCDPIAAFAGELGDCSVRCVAFRNRDEILSGDSLGQLQVRFLSLTIVDVQFFSPARTVCTSQQWDRRQRSSLGPVVSMHSEQKQSVIHDIAVHPSHNYSVAATDDDGSLVMWDVRHPIFPQSITAVHRPEAPEVWQVGFNPTRPDHLFTAGEDGCLVHWDTAGGGVGTAGIGRSFAIGGDVDLKYLSQDCLGINALDVEPELVAYGNDEEKLVIVVPAY